MRSGRPRGRPPARFLGRDGNALRNFTLKWRVMVLVVVAGGPNTLQTVLDTLYKGGPVVVFGGSLEVGIDGRRANLLPLMTRTPTHVNMLYM